MSIGKDGSCGSCGREFQGEYLVGDECPEKDDCPSHIEENGLIWWGESQKNINDKFDV
jgi:hypothetical protein